MSLRALTLLALADWRERTRRPVFRVALLAMLILAALFLPSPGADYHTVDVGGWRGLYDSHWVGMSIALMATPLLPLIGFFLVKNALARDEESGVGDIVLTSGVSASVYLLGKFFSNLAVLLCMALVVALAGAGLQLWWGEDRHLQFLPLVLPLLLIVGPALVLVAASALLFEVTPGLRRGMGNVLWVFFWMSSIGMDVELSSGMLNLKQVTSGMQAQVQAVDPDYDGVSFSLGFRLEKPGTEHRVWRWTGMDWSAEQIAQRGRVCLLALPLLLLARLLFRRFERLRQPRGAARPSSGRLARWLGRFSPSGPVLALLPSAWAAELRLLLRHTAWWWSLAVLGLNVAALVTDAEPLRRVVLPALGLAPVLVWSSLGQRAAAQGVDGLLGACAHPLRRQLFAAYGAACLYTALIFAGPLLRLGLDDEVQALLGLMVAVGFIPALGLACGCLSRGSKLFQGVYVLLWYAGPLQQGPGLDFLGAAAPEPFLIAALAGLGLAFAASALRLRWR
ncbi:MAG: ABC transporter permease subunit [Gammaproteobacteria bacterium]|nr:ABC transporter permease subunit [Gammaproteobacteria bacterium]